MHITDLYLCKYALGQGKHDATTNWTCAGKDAVQIRSGHSDTHSKSSCKYKTCLYIKSRSSRLSGSAFNKLEEPFHGAPGLLLVGAALIDKGSTTCAHPAVCKTTQVSNATNQEHNMGTTASIRHQLHQCMVHVVHCVY